jgi:hypothetical protein
MPRSMQVTSRVDRWLCGSGFPRSISRARMATPSAVDTGADTEACHLKTYFNQRDAVYSSQAYPSLTKKVRSPWVRPAPL